MTGARLYDGVTGGAHDVEVEFAGDRLALSQTEGWHEEVPASLLRRTEGGAGAIRLARSDIAGWRLVLPSDCEDQVTTLLGRPDRYGGWIDRIGLVPALVAFAALSLTVVALGYTAPGWIAPHVPQSWERNLGNAIVGDFGDIRCRSARGQQALEALVERVAPGATRGPDAIKVAALNVGIFNAAALPGGHVVVFRAAIAEAEPEALAGIMAHEVAHVRRRHVTEALVRELGVGALIRLFAGDVGANAQQLVSLRYTREAEAEADSDAIAMLRQANLSPIPTAKLFERFAKEQNEGLSYNAEFLQSHPLSRGRAQRFAASFDPKRRYGPALSRDDADALFDVCRRPPNNS